MADNLDDEEELFAILIENMFVSARGDFFMRFRHQTPLPQGQLTQQQLAMLTQGFLGMLRVGSDYVNDSADIYNLNPRTPLSQIWALQFGPALDRLCKMEAPLTNQLRALNIRFNPIRDLGGIYA